MCRFPRIIIVLAMLITPSISFGDGLNTSKIEILTEVAKALGDLGESIVKITDGIKHMVVTGEEGVSYVLAKKTKSDLMELSAQSTQFAVTLNIQVTESIDDYLLNPNPVDWPFVQQKLKNVLMRGSELLDEWKKERSDFIVEPAYARLIEALNSRVSILQRLSSMEAPITKEELDALKEVNTRYKNLVAQFRKAIEELNTYIKNENA